MRLVAAVVLTLCPLAACGTSPAPSPTSPTTMPTSTAPTASGSVSEPVPATGEPADPRIVRCGVDDNPKNILGASDENLRAPTMTELLSGEERALLGLASRPMKMMLPQPAGAVAAKPRPPMGLPTVALALPRASVVFQTASRADHPLDEAAKKAVVERRFDVSACVGQGAPANASVALAVRVASSGAPLDARATSSDLDERATRCVVELGCRLVLPPSATTGTLAIQAGFTVVEPVFKGSVNVRTSTEGSYVAALDSGMDKIDQALKPLLEACAKKTPPAASLSFPLRTTLGPTHVLVPRPSQSTGATERLLACLLPQLEAAVGPVAPALQKQPGFRTTFSINVSAP